MQLLSRRLVLVAGTVAALLAATAASAQWVWRDASGSMVFSDQAPPKSVAEKDIVRRPDPAAMRRANTQPAAAADTAPDAKPEAEAKKAATPVPAAPKTVAEREIEARRRQQQLAEAQKKAAEEEQRKTQTAENCERLRSYQRALDDGMRIARVNAAGEREVIDDATRAAEAERVRTQLDQHCR